MGLAGQDWQGRIGRLSGRSILRADKAGEHQDNQEVGQRCRRAWVARYKMNKLLIALAPIGLMLSAGQAGALPKWAAGPVPEELREPSWQQVRIEQHFSIRISPSAPMMAPDMLEDLRDEQPSPRFAERPMGKCVSVRGLVGVQSAPGSRLLLFMRDRAVVSAQLEKACQSRDFYSGFYIERPEDGQLCVNRDKLQSRSGANCKILRLRALVEAGSRRFP